MAKLSLEDFDKHIENLRAQLSFLNETLDGTDHNAPDWLATDLISLRNKSGRLQDDMKRFRDQLESEGLAEKKTKTSHKRLSIEGAKATVPTPKPRDPTPNPQAISPAVDQSPAPRAKAAAEGTYVVPHVDVTEEVNRRLQMSRLRRLMETPSTAQKRKFDTYEEEPRSEGAPGTDEGLGGAHNGSERDRTPTKRLKSSGTLEDMSKRKESSDFRRHSDRFEDRTDVKRLVCPIIALLPPRKLDLYTFSLGVGFYLSADHLTTLRTGRGLVQSMSPWRAVDLPTERAKETQRILREEREKSRKMMERNDGQEKGILSKLWMGDEEEGWKEKRLEEERKALEEGKGYGEMIIEQIWDVWNWNRNKGKEDDGKKE
ncbi:hypothetical protein CFE70_004698 [Pyrenophora teres f. teres 0-1]